MVEAEQLATAQQLPKAVDHASAYREHPHYRLSDGSGRRQGDSPGTRKVAFIALKNLQNPRICHVPM
jgi:hypothetical protein